MGGRMGNGNEPRPVALNPYALYALLILAGGGGGIATSIFSGADQSAIDRCNKNADIALQVVAQHGDEFNELRNHLLERTRYRYTSEDASADKARQTQIDEIQNQRIAHLEQLLRDLRK